MNKKTVVILTVDEAKDALVKHFVDFLVATPSHLGTLLREGKLHELPNFGNMTGAQVCDLYRENGVARDFTDVDFVAVRVGNNLEIVS